MKRILLFSGGMDSFILFKLQGADQLLRIRVGSRYDDVEEQRVSSMLDAGVIPRDRLTIETRLSLSDWEREDAIIPFRNLFFAIIGAYHGDIITLASTHGDNNRDKDEVFFAQASGLLTYIVRDPHYTTPRRSVTVAAPLRLKTKTEILRDYLEAGHDAEMLSMTISCYTPVEGAPCGNCLPCVRRYVAFAVNGLRGFEQYAEDPKRSPFARRAVELARQGHRGREDSDTIAALDR